MRARATRECECCGEEFSGIPSAMKTRRFCSHKCSDLGRRVRVICICEQCGKEYTVKGMYEGRQRFCSMSCFGEHRKNRVVKVCVRCLQEYEVPLNQAERRKFCSADCANQNRSKVVVKRCPSCGRTFARKPYEQTETCSQMCAGKLRSQSIVKKCEVCGKEYPVQKANRRRSRFCSKECQGRAKRKVRNPPTSKQLEYLLIHKTQRAIGEMYGVAPNAVRYWAKKYGLKLPDKKERYQLQKTVGATWRMMIEERLTELIGES